MTDKAMREFFLPPEKVIDKDIVYCPRVEFKTEQDRILVRLVRQGPEYTVEAVIRGLGVFPSEKIYDDEHLAAEALDTYVSRISAGMAPVIADGKLVWDL